MQQKLPAENPFVCFAEASCEEVVFGSVCCTYIWPDGTTERDHIMEPERLSSSDIAKPPPGVLAPLSLRFSPDGSLLTFLFPEADGLRQVFGVDCGAGSSSFAPKKLLDVQTSKEISHQEQLRRERMRLFAHGVTSYEWCGTSSEDQKMLVPLGGQVMLFDPNASVASEKLRVIYDASAGASVDPHLAPNAQSVAFVIDDDLYVQAISSSSSSSGSSSSNSSSSEGGSGDGDEQVSMPLVRMTTNGAKPGITCGLADFIAQEEMDRYRGFWWSPDSSRIAYTETDESHVPEYQINHQGKSDPLHTETHRYPFSGKSNPIVKLAVVEVGGGAAPAPSVWMDLAGPASGAINADDYYLGRVGWWPDGSVMAQVQNRAQSVLQLVRLDALTGVRAVLVEENNGVWINLHDMLHNLDLCWSSAHAGTARANGDFSFLWASERSGYCHLYLYHYDAASGSCVCQFEGQPIGGGGDWCVESIDGVDENAATGTLTVYFSGNKDNHTQRHFYSVCLQPASSTNASVVQLTQSPGWHSCAVSPKQGVFADMFSSRSSLPTMSLFSLQGEAAPRLLAPLLTSEQSHPKPELAAVAAILRAPSIEEIPTRDGRTTLFCSLYLPDPAVHGPGPYPTIMSVYGGPHVQRVCDYWLLTADLRAQRLAQDGCVVIKCDNRGSSRRGHAFEAALHRDMGNIEVVDQQTAVEHYVKQGLVDPARVGMFGWSYGGYMSAMSLCRAPETFCCAVAGAPVTSWDGYDTHYTERYMGTPQNNAEGYENSSVMTHVSKMKGRLMLVHGLIDENVHFRHTARLINALIQERKPYDLILFPCERHSPHKPQDRVYLEDRMIDFLSQEMAKHAAQRKAEEASPAAATASSTSKPVIKFAAAL